MAKLNQLLLATSNPGKFQEMADFLKNLPLELLSLSDLNLAADFEENGLSFQENALGKAFYYHQKSGMMTLAEDSGILVEALKDQLGVKTRRWGKGESATDQEWVDYFLEVMRNVPLENRKAAFVCSAALVDHEGKSFTFEGKTEGSITQNLEATIQKGLPLSSCFKPAGFEKVYAALTMEEKNLISHRGKAMGQVKEFLGKEI